MNFVIVALLALGAQPVPPGASYGPPQQMGDAPQQDCNCEACCRQRAAGGGGVAGRIGACYQKLAHNVATAWMEPQTNYNPRFGCYGSNDRFMHRYPAFHGHYYRRPYNYRTEFDYPWHAELHEPTSLFSYGFGNEGEGPAMRNPEAPGRGPEPAARSNARDPRASTSPRPKNVQTAKLRPTIDRDDEEEDDLPRTATTATSRRY